MSTRGLNRFIAPAALAVALIGGLAATPAQAATSAEVNSSRVVAAASVVDQPSGRTVTTSVKLVSPAAAANTITPMAGNTNEKYEGYNWKKSQSFLAVYKNSTTKTYKKIQPGQYIPRGYKYYKPAKGYKACRVNWLKVRTGGQSCVTKRTKLPVFDYEYRVTKIKK